MTGLSETSPNSSVHTHQQLATVGHIVIQGNYLRIQHTKLNNAPFSLLAVIVY